MEQRNEPTPESEAALRERLARLSQASLRINESLDSARSLTGARYGVMTLLDGAGQVQDCLSSGLRAEESERLWLMRYAPPPRVMIRSVLLQRVWGLERRGESWLGGTL